MDSPVEYKPNEIYINEIYLYHGRIKREKLGEREEEGVRVIRRPLGLKYINGQYLLIATSVAPQPSTLSVGSVKDLSIIIPALVLQSKSQKRYYIDQVKI